MSGFHTIVVALDFSDSTHDALDAALALAATDAGSHVHLLHVVPSALPQLWTDEPTPLDLRIVEQGRADAALKELERLSGSQALDPPRMTTAVEIGAPANEIVRYAEQQGADVVVLGSHGHGLVRGSCSAAWPTNWSARRPAPCWSWRTGRCGMRRRRHPPPPALQ